MHAGNWPFHVLRSYTITTTALTGSLNLSVAAPPKLSAHSHEALVPFMAPLTPLLYYFRYVTWAAASFALLFHSHIHRCRVIFFVLALPL